MRRKRFIFFLPIVLIALLISVPLVMAKGPPMGAFWSVNGNAGTDPPNDFLGTTDDMDLVIRTNKTEKMRIESGGNVGIGTDAPSEQLEITGNFRLPATTGTTGSHVGVIKSGESLYIHNFGTDNFFAGEDAGNLTMMGAATRNTGVGFNALNSLTLGIANTATGKGALAENLGGSNNTATGKEALAKNTAGIDNTGIGYQALDVLDTGSRNIALGQNAGGALETGSDNIAIGNLGVAMESGTIRIGCSSSCPASGSPQTKTFIAGIRGEPVTGEVTVLIDANGQLGTTVSSRRFKRDIRDMGEATDALMELRPVVFAYKSDATGRTQYGLIAEEVAEVYPELVVRSADGQIESVRYHLLSSMLLNELQQQQQTISSLEARLEALEQAAGIDTGSAEPMTSGMLNPWLLFSGLAMGGLVLGGMVTVRRTRRGNQE